MGKSSELHFGKSSCAFIYIHWTHKTITKLPFDKSKDKLHTIPHSSNLSALASALSITNFQIQTQKNLYQIHKLAKGRKKKSIPCKLGFLKMKNKKTSEYSKIFQMEFVPILRWMDYGGLEKKLKSLSKRTDEFLQALPNLI